MPNVTGFLKHVKTGLKKYGIDSQNGMAQMPLPKMIIVTVADVYEVTPKAIITSNKRGAVTEGKTMAIILLHKHTPLLQSEIAAKFNRSESLICKRIAAFQVAKDGEPLADKMFLQPRFIQNYRIVNEKIIIFKNSQGV